MLRYFLVFAALITGFGSTNVLAQTPTSTPRTTDQLIDQVCDFLKAQQSFSVDMDINYDELLEIGSKVQYGAYQKVLVAKPSGLRLDYVGDERTTNFYYDGKNFTLEAPNLKYYTSKSAPANLDALLVQIEEKYGVTLPMSNLLASDPCKDLDNDFNESFFIGDNLVGKEETYQILLVGDDRNVQIWVTKDKQPLLRKATIDYKDLPESPQYTVVFSNWNFEPEIPANAFTFTPAKDDIQVEFLPTNKLNLTPANN